jgi:hypothetical protein
LEKVSSTLCWAALVAVSLPADRQALKCTPSSLNRGVVPMIVVMGVLPLAGFIAIHTLGRTYYVPLMRGQRVESLEPIGLLRPLVTPEPRAQVPFRVAETGRVVWPGGGCHPSVWPVGRMGFTVVRVFGPLLLVPVMHWVTSTLPC